MPYLFVAAFLAVLAAWWHFNTWFGRSPTAKKSRSPLWLGFTATAASALFLISGSIGYNLSKRSRFLTGTAWNDGVIWWQVAVGVVLVPLALYLLRRGARDIDRSLGSQSW